MRKEKVHVKGGILEFDILKDVDAEFTAVMNIYIETDIGKSA
ncbi:hypothetical protein AmDm5_0871 [Acetobacter malorum]|nr:hypothetical protein AmDm5_0871 [Acetobacter malorum]